MLVLLRLSVDVGRRAERGNFCVDNLETFTVNDAGT